MLQQLLIWSLNFRNRRLRIRSLEKISAITVRRLDGIDLERLIQLSDNQEKHWISMDRPRENEIG